MKKTLTIAAAALISASAFAQTVTSANVVGYVKTGTPDAGSFDIIAASQFSDGTNSTISIQDIIGNKDALNAAAYPNKANADKIHVWTGSGYTSYGLYDTGTEVYWMDMANGAWNSPFGVAAASTDVIPRGTGLWFETGAGGTSTNVISSGDVFNDGQFDVDLVSSFDIITFPFSSTVSLTNLVVSNAVAAAYPNKANADKIYVWTGSGYASYGLYDAGTETFWMDMGNGAWNSPFGVAVEATDTIDLGVGFWYESPAGAKTIGFTQNYTLD
jgi:hypothetical protein